MVLLWHHLKQPFLSPLFWKIYVTLLQFFIQLPDSKHELCPRLSSDTLLAPSHCNSHLIRCTGKRQPRRRETTSILQLWRCHTAYLSRPLRSRTAVGVLCWESARALTCLVALEVSTHNILLREQHGPLWKCPEREPTQGLAMRRRISLALDPSITMVRPRKPCGWWTHTCLWKGYQNHFWFKIKTFAFWFIQLCHVWNISDKHTDVDNHHPLL